MVGYGSRFSKSCQKIIAIIMVGCGLIFSCSGLAQLGKKTAYASGGSSTLVMEVTSKRVLSCSNERMELPMASTTKIMTALLAVERCDLQQKVTIPKQAVGVEGSSIYLKQGEVLTVKDLLYGLMLRSGNDSAVALAIHMSGSVSAFADLMNARVAEMGLKNTHFVNPHGLHDKNHYTSAYDLAYISSIAMQNETFKDIVSTKSVTIQGATIDENRYLANKNKMLTMYSGANGIKTGYTKDAGRCLVSSSLVDGMQLVCVVLNVYDMWNESISLLDNANNSYAMQQAIDSKQVLQEIGVTGSKTTSVGVKCHSNFSYPLKKDGSEHLEVEINCAESVVAPHKMSESVGEIKIKMANHLLFSDKIYTIIDITELTLKDKVKDFLGIGD